MAASTTIQRRRRLESDVAAIIGRLPEVERRVLTRRLGLHDGAVHTLAATGRELGLGTVEVSEIEARALARLRELVGPDRARRLLARA